VEQSHAGPGAEHWLLPAVNTWVISIHCTAPLARSALTSHRWWLLVVIPTAEYTIDADDLRQPIAEAVLTAISFAAYLLLAIALRAAETRLYLILPALAITASVVSLRTWHLRLGGEWAWIEAGLVLVIVGQIAAALHYWPCRLFPTGWQYSVRLCDDQPGHQLARRLSAGSPGHW
jgi:hypothetical protein